VSRAVLISTARRHNPDELRNPVERAAVGKGYSRISLGSRASATAGKDMGQKGDGKGPPSRRALASARAPATSISRPHPALCGPRWWRLWKPPRMLIDPPGTISSRSWTRATPRSSYAGSR